MRATRDGVRNGAAAARATPPLAGLLAGLRLALGAGDAARHRATLARVADWPAVAGLAFRHRVGTLFLHGLRNGGVRLPDPAVNHALADARRRVALHGTRQLDAMRRAVAGLTALDVPVLVLKGLPLGQRLYGSPFAKSSIDIDLLVPQEAFAVAGRTLQDLGWRRTDFPETPARTRWCDRMRYERVFSGPGGKLELHPNLLHNPFLFDPPFADLDANSATVEIAGCRFRTLGDGDQLLYLACHGSLHCWERLKWLCDFAMLIRSLDGDAFARAVARGAAGRLSRAVAPALLLAREALHVDTPPGANRSQAPRPRNRLVVALSRRTWTPREGPAGQIMHKAAIHAGRFLIGSGLRYALYEIRKWLIRPQDFRRLNLPDRLFWLYVPLRPALWIARLLHGQAQ